MLVVLVAFTAATSPVPLAAARAAVPLDEARHALSVGRLDQARTMIANAVAAGASGEPVDHLLADLAFAKADDAQALSLYRALLPGHADDAAMLGQAGIAALRLGDSQQATALLRQAVALPRADWRAWNALGAAADSRRDWTAADLAYDRALALAPHRAEVANNRGWSLVLRGRWHEAEAELARGVALDPSLPRLTNNLELARDTIATNLPERRVGESDAAWAARLNDSGVAAAGQGDRARAVAAFARSIAARPAWDAQTAANLAAVEANR